MSYKLYTDRQEDFTCEVSIKNASLKGSIARLIIESFDGPSLVFNGELNGDRCIIPIKRLKGLIDKNTRGNMHLEVIVEDTYFKPWASDFVVEEHTSVKVKVNENKQSSNKPTVEVKVHPLLKYINGTPQTRHLISKKRGINVYVPKTEIATICEMFGIRKNNFNKRKNDFLKIIKEYFRANKDYKKHASLILHEIVGFLK